LKVYVYECLLHGEFEFTEPLEEKPPKCPECGRLMRFVTVYEE
jgi:hypothetical protein